MQGLEKGAAKCREPHSNLGVSCFFPEIRSFVGGDTGYSFLPSRLCENGYLFSSGSDELASLRLLK